MLADHRPHAAGGEPVELEGEDEDRHQPEPEGGHAVAEEGEEHTDAVEDRVLLGGGDDAGRETDQEGDDGRSRRQDEGVLKALQDEGQDLGALLEGDAEIALEDLAQPLDVLDVDRLVEPEGFAQVGDILGAGGETEEGLGDVPGDQFHQEEDDEGDPEEDRDQTEQPAQNVGRHAGGSPLDILDRQRNRRSASACKSSPLTAREEASVRRAAQQSGS